jgi:hypothetical protein
LQNKPSIIISSGFVEEFEEYIDKKSVHSSSEEKLHYNNEKGKKIRIITKQEIINDHEKVVKEIESILQKNK